MSHPHTTTQFPSLRTQATTQGNSERSLPTYAVVERICAIPGVCRVNAVGDIAYALTDYSVFNRKSFLEVGDSPEDAMLKLEQAVRDAYMAVS